MQPLAKELGIRVVPTFKILKDNKVVKEVTGAKYDDLVAAIETARSAASGWTSLSCLYHNCLYVMWNLVLSLYIGDEETSAKDYLVCVKVSRNMIMKMIIFRFPVDSVWRISKQFGTEFGRFGAMCTSKFVFLIGDIVWKLWITIVRTSTSLIEFILYIKHQQWGSLWNTSDWLDSKLVKRRDRKDGSNIYHSRQVCWMGSAW